MADKGLNLTDECAAEFVNLCPQEDECTISSWGDSKMYNPGTITNSQTDRGRQLKFKKCCCCQSKSFSGNNNTSRDI